jgi:hypothetical protein
VGRCLTPKRTPLQGLVLGGVGAALEGVQELAADLPVCFQPALAVANEAGGQGGKLPVELLKVRG